jgi:hypothetical protein
VVAVLVLVLVADAFTRLLSSFPVSALARGLVGKSAVVVFPHVNLLSSIHTRYIAAYAIATLPAWP